MSDVTVEIGAASPASSAQPMKIDGAVIVDSKGRKIILREPDVLQESRLVRAMGQDASNFTYMTGYVQPAAMAAEIDGDTLPFPNSSRDIEVTLKQLGHHGLTAIMQHIIAVSKAPANDSNEVRDLKK